MWSLWQAAHPTAPYLPATGGPAGHNLNDPMYPWDGIASADIVSPNDVWDYQGNRGYSYDPVPA